MEYLRQQLQFDTFLERLQILLDINYIKWFIKKHFIVPNDRKAYMTTGHV